MNVKPLPQRDSLTKIILMAYARGKAVLAAREKTARPVSQTPKNETRERNP